MNADDLAQHFQFIVNFVENHRSEIIEIRKSNFNVRARIFWKLGDAVLSASLDARDLATIAACVDGIDISIV